MSDLVDLVAKEIFETFREKEWFDHLPETAKEDYHIAAEAAIRAYEAHKASAVPDDDMGDEEDAPQSIHLAWGLYYKASTVPEEIAEVVEWCRRKGLGTPPDSMPNRAADLLEGQAREIASLKGELKHCEEVYENAVTYPNDAES